MNRLQKIIYDDDFREISDFFEYGICSIYFIDILMLNEITLVQDDYN